MPSRSVLLVYAYSESPAGACEVAALLQMEKPGEAAARPAGSVTAVVWCLLQGKGAHLRADDSPAP